MPWGIEQPSTFGRLGGCLCEAFVAVCGISAATLAVVYTARTEQTPDDTHSPKIESIQQDTTRAPNDTTVVAFFDYRTLGKFQKTK